MDYTNKSKTTYKINNNIIIITKTKYYAKKHVNNVKIMTIVEYRKYKHEKTYTKKNKNNKKKIQ